MVIVGFQRWRRPPIAPGVTVGREGGTERHHLPPLSASHQHRSRSHASQPPRYFHHPSASKLSATSASASSSHRNPRPPSTAHRALTLSTTKTPAKRIAAPSPPILRRSSMFAARLSADRFPPPPHRTIPKFSPLRLRPQTEPRPPTAALPPPPHRYPQGDTDSRGIPPVARVAFGDYSFTRGFEVSRVWFSTILWIGY